MADQTFRATRFRVGGMKVIYDTGEEFWSGPVVDVSESGMFVETSHELPVGTRVTLLLDARDDEHLPFEIKAEVARTTSYDTDRNWQRPPGIAFHLVGMRLEDMAQVRDFLHRHGVAVRVENAT